MHTKQPILLLGSENLLNEQTSPMSSLQEEHQPSNAILKIPQVLCDNNILHIVYRKVKNLH